MKQLHKNEEGIALIIVVSMIALVGGLMVMVLDISGTERNLAGINQRSVQSFHAAGGGNEISNQVIKDALDLNAIPTVPKGYPATVVVDSSNSTTIGDPTLPDLIEELRNGGGALGNDSVNDVVPDLLVTSLNNQRIQVDIDLEEGDVMLPGSELKEFGAAHHKKVGGTGCPAGTLYNVDTVSTGPLNTQSKVGTAYFDCPS